MDWDRLITIEQMEEATNTLLETGKKKFKGHSKET